MKVTQALLGSTIFFLVLVVTYYAHVTYFKVNVVFYAAVFDGVVATIITGVIVFSPRPFCSLSRFEKSLLVVIWLIMGYALAISVPTVIDRSLSFYILEKIQQRGGAIRQDAFERIFTEEYVKEHHLVSVRLTEQVESGTITIENGCVLLTPKGKLLVRVSRSFRQYWLPKQRLLLEEYSDVLIDPFRNSSVVEQYRCKK